MVFTDQQKTLVKESWEVLKQDIPGLGMRLFSLILEIAPAAKGMFSFLKDSDEIPQNNPKLKAHATKLFKMANMCLTDVSHMLLQYRQTCESAIQLPEEATLKYLASSHVKIGVVDAHFEVVKEALLRTVKEGMGEKWSEDLNGAWDEAYVLLADAIMAEMKKQQE